jgi:predicted PurR-regulated permease PerM
MSRFALQRRALDRLRQARAQAAAPAPVPRPVRPAPTADRHHPVPLTLRNAAEWSWRFLLVAAALLVILKGLTILSQIVIPLLVALLLAALLEPLFNTLSSRLPRGLAAGLTVLTLILVLSGAFTVIGRTLSDGLGDVTDQVLQGIEEVRAWVRDTFGITNVQIDDYIDQAGDTVTSNAGEGIGPVLATVGLTAGHFIAGFFIALFALFFFLSDGQRIWSWAIRFFPRATRGGVDEAGHIAWGQLSAFTRATVIVALVDAVGITFVAVLLDVPFPAVIFLLVFIGAFIPVIGAGISGTVAVLLALVAQGPITALLMLAGVIGVQQIESHLLQPLLLGRVMKLHPLGVILAIAAGVVLAGITGALIAVPVVAVLNAVGKYYFADEDVTASDEGVLDPDPVTDLPPDRRAPAQPSAVGGDD